MRILWATNAAAPYRLPVWESLAERHELRVIVLENESKLLDGSLNRGGDWVAGGENQFSIASRRTCVVERGEGRYYTLPPSFGPSPIRDADALLLGGWESPAYWQMLAQAKARRVRTVGFYESTLLSQRHTAGLIGLARSTFFKSLDAVVVPGAAALEAVLDMGVPRPQVFVGFNAVDGDAINLGAREARVETDGDAARGHRYLCIAQLIDRKNVASLIEAFALVRTDGDTLQVVGIGPLERELKAAARGLPVDFQRQVPYRELPSLFAEHDTLVLPSTQEVWGLVVNEALAAGLNVVVSDRCGVIDSIKGMDGTFVCAPDPAALSVAMEASRRSWTGPRDKPTILRYGPAEFASVFETALQVKKLEKLADLQQ